MSKVLRVAPEELMQLANNVANKAEEMSNRLRELDDKIDTVKNNWEGMGANAFYNKYVEVRESLQIFPEVVQGVAAQAQNAAQVYDKTDSDIAAALS